MLNLSEWYLQRKHKPCPRGWYLTHSKSTSKWLVHHTEQFLFWFQTCKCDIRWGGLTNVHWVEVGPCQKICQNDQFIKLSNFCHLCHDIASKKVEKWRKSGQNPSEMGSEGRINPIIFKGEVELIINIQNPLGMTPGAPSKSRFLSKSVLNQLYSSNYIP